MAPVKISHVVSFTSQVIPGLASLVAFISLDSGGCQVSL